MGFGPGLRLLVEGPGFCALFEFRGMGLLTLVDSRAGEGGVREQNYVLLQRGCVAGRAFLCRIGRMGLLWAWLRKRGGDPRACFSLGEERGGGSGLLLLG